MRTPGRARLGVATLVVAGCAGSAEPPVTITAVTPSSAYSDAKIPLVIHGGPFRPIYDIDTSGGTETVELGAFTAFLSPSDGIGAAQPANSPMWVSTSDLAVELPKDIPSGPYDVEVRDPRGRLAVRAMGFVSLGPDHQPPVVTIDEPEPRTIVNAGAEVPVAYEADDGPGYIRALDWKVAWADMEMSGSCPVDLPVHHVTCRFVFVVPTPVQNGQPLTIVAAATDTGLGQGQVAKAETTLAIGLAPVVVSFEPSEGAASGGTSFTVTGKNFIAGTQVLVGGVPLVAGGGTLMGDTVIQGKTPAHDPGLVTVAVRTGATSVEASGKFSFVGRPEVRAVTPSEGPLAGCTPVVVTGKYFRERPLTSVSFGSDATSGAPLQCPSYKSDNRMEGVTPPGAGAVSVFASDPVGGTGSLNLAFTYLAVDSPDGGAGPAACPCDGAASP